MKKQHKKYCFALDLINDEALIQAYIEYHKKVWPEIIHQIKDTGVESMEINWSHSLIVDPSFRHYSLVCLMKQA